MRYGVVLKVLSLIILITGISMLLPLPFSFYYGDKDFMALLISSGISISIGLPLFFFTSRIKEDIKIKEGFAIVSLGWLTFTLIGAMPYMFSGVTKTFTDAFFETMSGFTTTGATILTDIESVPHGILFWRSLTHWLGGMGLIVLTVAILPILGVGGMQMFKAESPGPTIDKITPRITATAKILWTIYVFFTLLEATLLLISGMNLFDALCHSFGTMATGGFSSKNASISAYPSAWIHYIITIFMIIAGINFSLHYKLLIGKFKDFFGSSELRLFISIIVLSTILVFLQVIIHHYETTSEAIQFSLFQVVSIMTTTGYGTADYEQWTLTSQIILLILMYIGGCAGSTAGGIKVIRLLILLKFANNEIKRLLHPNALIAVKVGKQLIDRKILVNVAGFFIIYIIIAIFSVFFLSSFGVDFTTSIGSVSATLNNVGPGIGMVGPTENYAHLPELVKWYLSLLMMVGRLEVYTVIILFVPAFWKK